MKHKKLYIFLAIIVIILLFLYSLSKINIFQPSGTNPSSSSTSPTISILTPSGQVQIPDVTQNPVEKTPDTTAIVETSDYQIVYFPKDKAFSIVLLSRPVQNARDGAEAAFLDKLQISKGDACKLTVSLAVPYDVDQNLSGKDYGLSFCPKGTPF